MKQKQIPKSKNSNFHSHPFPKKRRIPNLDPVENIVVNGPLQGTISKLKTRIRGDKPQDVHATNDHAIEIYLKVPKNKSWTYKLPNSDGWKDFGSYMIKSRDTWIDPDDPKAQQLMFIFSDSLRYYLNELSIHPDVVRNPKKAFTNISAIIDKLENHILANKDNLVKHLDNNFSQATPAKVFNECLSNDVMSFSQKLCPFGR